MMLSTRLANTSMIMSTKWPSIRMDKLNQLMDPRVHMATGTAMASQPADRNGQLKPSQAWSKSTITVKTHQMSKLSNWITTETRNGLSFQTAEVTQEKSPLRLTYQTALLLLASPLSFSTSKPPAKTQIERAMTAARASNHLFKI